MSTSVEDRINQINGQMDAINDRITAKLAELDNVIAAINTLLTSPPQVSYTISGGGGTQSFSHNEYKEWLGNLQHQIVEELADLQKIYLNFQTMKNTFKPYWYISRGV